MAEQARSSTGGSRARRRMAVTGLAALCAGGGLLGSGVASASSSPVAARPASSSGGPGTTTLSGPAVTMTWSHTYAGVTAQSSPAPFTVNHRTAVVVGSRGGQLHAYYAASGDTVPGFPVTTPGAQPIDSTPSIYPGAQRILIGTGNASKPTGGGYLAYSFTGRKVWARDVATQPGGSTASGVQASLAIGYLQGSGKSAVAGTLGQQEEELNAASGAVRPGFPWFSSDTEFSTPAIANVFGNGTDYIIEGAEQTAGTAYGHTYSEGGHLRILKPTGNSGTGNPGGGVVCDYTPNQGVYSSPAVGRFLSKAAVGIVAGTSTDVKGASDTDKLIAINTSCKVVWSQPLDGSTQSSPSLVGALGEGIQVAEGTMSGTNGYVYLLDGANGDTYWKTEVPGEVIGGIASANLGGGYQDLIVPTTGGAVILNGKTGRIMDELAKGVFGEQNSPLVTDDPDGKIGITLAGYNANGGEVAHFEVAGTKGSLYDEAGAWPEFHHDQQLTGTTLAPLKKS